ncbi:MAG: hypothetical protein E7214_01585 [Clostridium sp.]|nr:hypothetical protein [Clostridium sp.]
MKKFFRDVLIIILIVTLAFSVYKISSKYKFDILKDNVECNVILKNCEKARAITIDDNNYKYIAYKESIKSIDNFGKEKVLYKNQDSDIEDIVYWNNKLIYISDDAIQSFSLEDSSVETLCCGIPKGGNGISRKLQVKEDKIFISIGAATNSGIAEGENIDLPPIDLVLNDVNYGQFQTGIFKRVGVKNKDGEKVRGVKIGNGAIYTLNLKNNEIKLFSSGIRGVTGFGFNSEGNIYGIFSGMKNEGLRPVNRDKDYIYEIKGGRWYGWPDYSGGDYISSPRFKGETLIKPLLKKTPVRYMDPPLYQHEEVDSLRELAIDTDGEVLEKNSIVLWDRSKEMISVFNNKGVFYNLLKLKDESNISDIVYKNNEFLILDDALGCIYSIHQKKGILGFKLPLSIWIYIFSLCLLLLIICVLKLNKGNEK